MQGSKKVPCWMFIRWISQMMALLDKEEGPCVVPILTEIAREYPQVLHVHPHCSDNTHTHTHTHTHNSEFSAHRLSTSRSASVPRALWRARASLWRR
jgi:hypothetical protein